MGLGLANTRARLKQLYGDAAELRTENGQPGGAQVTMVLPFHVVEPGAHDDEAMNALIVDDEPLAREGMTLLLKEEPSITAIVVARNGAEAVDAIRDHRPDLVLLDVQMPEMDGFGVLREIGAEHMPPVIFVTAHDRYAIQAFEVNAIDYLLKPVTRERCSQALSRVRERLCRPGQPPRDVTAATARDPAEVPGPRGAACGRQDLLRQHRRRTVRPGGRELRATAPEDAATPAARADRDLRDFARPGVFLRIHRSLIVNVKHILELETGPHGEYIMVLHGGMRLQSSRSYHDKIKRWASNPF